MLCLMSRNQAKHCLISGIQFSLLIKATLSRSTNRNVQAIEYLVKEKLDKDPELQKIREFAHFACTSEDINNLSYAGIFKESLGQVLLPAMHKLLEALAGHAKTSADVAMMSLTHGQPATPTTFGKEMANVTRRLSVHFEKVNTLRTKCTMLSLIVGMKRAC